MQTKNFGKADQIATSTRSRSVLGEVKNVNSCLPHKLKKTDACRNFTQSCKEIRENQKPNTAKSLLRQTYSHLNQEEVSALQSFCKQRRDIRADLLSQRNAEIYMELDKDATVDTASVSVYAETIFNHLQDRELNSEPLHAEFLRNCSEITPRMRYILVNWLVQVHQSYKLQPETLYLCVALMDRYIQVRFFVW